MHAQIGIDYTSAIHQTAGIGRYTREMVNALAKLSSGDSFAPNYRLFVADAGKVSLPSLPGRNFRWSASRLTERRLARLWYRLRLPLPINYWTGPIDLFHAADFILPPVKPSAKTIVTIHDLSFVREPDSVMPGMSAHLNKWVPQSVEKADHVIAVSKATGHDLINLYHTPPEKISVLYHGVTPKFKPVRDKSRLAAVRQKYGLGSSPFILSVGTIQPRKNHRRLIRAFGQLDHQYSLVIAGEKGWLYQEIFKEVARLGLQNRVHFTGFVDDADLPALYSAATLFAYPSLYEGFGLPVLEAMACGTPVVTANQSSLPEVAGTAGLMVDPKKTDAIASAMAQVLTNPDLHKKLSDAGQIQATKFTWAAMAQNLLELYKSLLGSQ